MFIIGLCITVFALPLAVSMFRNLYLVSKYPSEYFLINGLSESDVAVMAIVFTVLTAVGIVLMLFGWIKRRNKAALDSIINAEKQNYCTNCNVNITAESTNCPICGKSLNNKGE